MERVKKNLNMVKNFLIVWVQCSKARKQNFQFWKLLAVAVDTHIKCDNKVHKRNYRIHSNLWNVLIIDAKKHFFSIV